MMKYLHLVMKLKLILLLCKNYHHLFTQKWEKYILSNIVNWRNKIRY